LHAEPLQPLTRTPNLNLFRRGGQVLLPLYRYP